MKLTGGKATLVNLAKVIKATKTTKSYPNHYVIHRDDPETLEGPILAFIFGKRTRKVANREGRANLLNIKVE
jgi:hypothetical protein